MAAQLFSNMVYYTNALNEGILFVGFVEDMDLARDIKSEESGFELGDGRIFERNKASVM